MLLFSNTRQMKVNRCLRCICVSKYNYPLVQLAQEGYRTRQNNKHTCLCLLPSIFFFFCISEFFCLYSLNCLWVGVVPVLWILFGIFLNLSSLHNYFSFFLANSTLKKAIPSLLQKESSLGLKSLLIEGLQYDI